MEYMGETFISARYKKEDFINLNLTMTSVEEDWNKAIDIFEDRIRERYLNIIDKIMNDGCLVVDGFSVMALNCLMIETLLQFKNGWDETPYRRNSMEYKRFLLEEFSGVFTNTELAQRFYTDIRCGILHSAQTKNGSQLTIDKDYIVEFIHTSRGRSISVNVVGISRIIRDYFSDYVDKIKSNSNEDERHYFLEKMRYLCIH
ncbi:hypothetical protein [Clostridium estertheticum]|uniref:hypothetical protein n=1 Tax=Clostridium estertheticum TaxID=238834 RepID=UPI001CF5ACFB|nr:hypothetical protein [Clostridium estertheticum]MCB2353921.1 hypothetical protein [Clostridium estertheticum]WAG43062.1 hypothetical protein LL065_10430 [Clostridium estertheticum]